MHDSHIKCLGHKFPAGHVVFCMLALSQFCEGEGEKSAKSTGPCAKGSGNMGFSLGKNPKQNITTNRQQNPEFRTRGSLGKDSSGHVPCCKTLHITSASSSG